MSREGDSGDGRAEGEAPPQQVEEEEDIEIPPDVEKANSTIREARAAMLPLPQQPNSTDNVVVVDCLPLVKDKLVKKLSDVLVTKVLSKIGPVQHFFMPTSDSGETLGFCIAAFETKEQAAAAVAKLDGHQFDKKHKLRANPYAYLEEVAKVPDAFEKTAENSFQSLENLRWWLSDECGLDQFVVRYANETEVFWNETLRKPEAIMKKSGMTDSYVAWSTFGSYLATVHGKGVKLWGGEQWKEIHKLAHSGVKVVEFSPQENYLLTLSPQFEDRDDPRDPQFVSIWNTMTGKKCRGFARSGKKSFAPSGAWHMHVFRWSHDDKYFARLCEDGVMVYETPSMKLLNKKKFSIPGVKDFAWSPGANIFACWVPGDDNKPARVILVDVATRKSLYSKTLFKLLGCKLMWHPQGDFLALKVDRYKRNKKISTASFELLRVKERDVPTEVLDMGKRDVVAFQWEPHGDRFGIIHGDGQSSRYDATFYKMGKKFTELATLESKPANTIFWAPRGKMAVLAGMGALNGALEFYNVDLQESMGDGDHYMATDLSWDPTGRYVCTYASAWRHQNENGYQIWSFKGDKIHKVQKERFYQMLWRPRPPSLLSKEQERSIKKNFEAYKERFDKLDAREETKFIQEKLDKMNEQERRWQELAKGWAAAYEATRAQREALAGTPPGEEDYETVEDVVEEVIEETVEPLDA